MADTVELVADTVAVGCRAVVGPVDNHLALAGSRQVLVAGPVDTRLVLVDSRLDLVDNRFVLVGRDMFGLEGPQSVPEIHIGYHGYLGVLG